MERVAEWPTSTRLMAADPTDLGGSLVTCRGTRRGGYRVTTKSMDIIKVEPETDPLVTGIEDVKADLKLQIMQGVFHEVNVEELKVKSLEQSCVSYNIKREKTEEEVDIYYPPAKSEPEESWTSSSVKKETLSHVVKEDVDFSETIISNLNECSQKELTRPENDLNSPKDRNQHFTADPVTHSLTPSSPTVPTPPSISSCSYREKKDNIIYEIHKHLKELSDSLDPVKDVKKDSDYTLSLSVFSALKSLKNPRHKYEFRRKLRSIITDMEETALSELINPE